MPLEGEFSGEFNTGWAGLGWAGWVSWAGWLVLAGGGGP